MGEISFFYEDFGTDKEFMDDKGVPKNVGRLKDFVAEYTSMEVRELSLFRTNLSQSLHVPASQA